MNESVKDCGEYRITINGTDVACIKNMITNAGLAALAKALTGLASAEIKYLAIGSSSTAVSASQTKLVNETARFALASASSNGAVTTTVFNILAGEGNGSIKEIGIFCGENATSARNSGTMLSRILWSHDKTNSEEITVTRTDTFGRA